MRHRFCSCHVCDLKRIAHWQHDLSVLRRHARLFETLPRAEVEDADGVRQNGACLTEDLLIGRLGHNLALLPAQSRVRPSEVGHDPIGEGGAIDLGRVEGLRSSLSQFAAICRRMQATDGFDLAAYDWYDKG